MIESHDAFDPINEIEAMVRAAGDYVHASRDLRPRVLETARAQRGERRAQRLIRQAAVGILLFVGFAASVGHALEMAGLDQQITFGSKSISWREAHASPGADAGWGIVKAFTDLRQRQSAAFRL